MPQVFALQLGVAMLALLAVPAVARADFLYAAPAGSQHYSSVGGISTAMHTNTPGASGSGITSALHTPHIRNRLIGPHLDVGVSTYSDCTGRTELTRKTAAIDTCVTWDVYFVGHSFGGPFTSLTHAYNGEILTWYNAAGVAHRYVIRGHQYTYALGPVDTPPHGTAAQFQTCLTPSGSRIITFYATSA
jgi:hypothetical protein